MEAPLPPVRRGVVAVCNVTLYPGAVCRPINKSPQDHKSSVDDREFNPQQHLSVSALKQVLAQLEKTILENLLYLIHVVKMFPNEKISCKNLKAKAKASIRDRNNLQK